MFTVRSTQRYSFDRQMCWQTKQKTNIRTNRRYCKIGFIALIDKKKKS